LLPAQTYSHGVIYSDLVVDPDSPELAYVQLANDLARRIESGEIKGRMPSERALAQEYGVAYQTARRAIGVLRDRGLVESVHGRGTFALPRD
jgi:GntR family transcriptional regulator